MLRSSTRAPSLHRLFRLVSVRELVAPFGQFPRSSNASFRLRRREKFAESGEEAIHFGGGVVMDQADAKNAAVRFDAETLGEVERVEVAVPGEDAAITEKRG